MYTVCSDKNQVSLHLQRREAALKHEDIYKYVSYDFSALSANFTRFHEGGGNPLMTWVKKKRLFLKFFVFHVLLLKTI